MWRCPACGIDFEEPSECTLLTACANADAKPEVAIDSINETSKSPVLADAKNRDPS